MLTSRSDKIHFYNIFFYFYFLNVNISVTPSSSSIKCYPLVNNISIEGTLSQIFNLGPSFYFMIENGKLSESFL